MPPPPAPTLEDSATLAEEEVLSPPLSLPPMVLPEEREAPLQLLLPTEAATVDGEAADGEGLLPLHLQLVPLLLLPSLVSTPQPSLYLNVERLLGITELAPACPLQQAPPNLMYWS